MNLRYIDYILDVFNATDACSSYVPEEKTPVVSYL